MTYKALVKLTMDDAGDKARSGQSVPRKLPEENFNL